MRIIAGTARGKKIESIEGLETRPTLDRVREAMFGSIQFDLPGAAVLDLFGGSGALGIEAVSRSADSAVINDRNPQCVKMIEKNVLSCGFKDRIQVVNEDYAVLIERLSKAKRKFRFVFIDAPYAAGTGYLAVCACFRSELVADGGSVILEHARTDTPGPVEGIAAVEKTKNYGKCAFSVYKRT